MTEEQARLEALRFAITYGHSKSPAQIVKSAALFEKFLVEGASNE